MVKRRPLRINKNQKKENKKMMEKKKYLQPQFEMTQMGGGIDVLAASNEQGFDVSSEEFWSSNSY